MKCPKCNSKNIFESEINKKFLPGLMKMVNKPKYYCIDCGCNFDIKEGR